MVRKVNVIALLIGLLAACAKVLEPERSLSPWLLSKVEASKGRRVEGPSKELSAIDSLMWQQPDSALRALMAYEGDASEYNGHYAQLLTSELLYKNDYEQTNRRELRQAVVYFDSLLCQFPPLQRGLGGFKTRPDQTNQIAFLSARAHYINGVGYYERDSVIEACREYLKALEVMEGHFEEKELVGKKARFIVLTYNRLGELFSAQFMTESAIVCGKEVLHFCKTAPASPYSVSNALYYIGKQYDIKNEKDSASYYYAKAIDFIPDTSNLFYRNMVTSKALLDYQLNHQIASPLRELHKVANQAKDEDERLTRYFIIGDIYFEEGMYDSALRYLDSVFQNKDNASIRMQVADYLRIIYDSIGDAEKADTYMRFLTQNKFTEPDSKAQVSELSDMFRDYLGRKQERRKTIGKTINIIVPIVVLVVAIIIITIKRRSKKQMERERHAHKMQQAALTGKLRKSNEALRELKGQLQQQENEAVSKPEQANSFADEPICQLILARVNEGQFKSQMDCTVYKDYALGKEQLMALREAADRHFNHFTSRLAQTYPSLTKNDLDYCCLYLLGLTDADVAALMQKAYSTVSDRSRKLKAVFESEESLSAALQGFVNSVATD